MCCDQDSTYQRKCELKELVKKYNVALGFNFSAFFGHKSDLGQ